MAEVIGSIPIAPTKNAINGFIRRCRPSALLATYLPGTPQSASVGALAKTISCVFYLLLLLEAGLLCSLCALSGVAPLRRSLRRTFSVRLGRPRPGPWLKSFLEFLFQLANLAKISSLR